MGATFCTLRNDLCNKTAHSKKHPTAINQFIYLTKSDNVAFLEPSLDSSRCNNEVIASLRTMLYTLVEFRNLCQVISNSNKGSKIDVISDLHDEFTVASNYKTLRKTASTGVKISGFKVSKTIPTASVPNHSASMGDPAVFHANKDKSGISLTSVISSMEATLKDLLDHYGKFAPNVKNRFSELETDVNSALTSTENLDTKLQIVKQELGATIKGLSESLSAPTVNGTIGLVASELLRLDNIVITDLIKKVNTIKSKSVEDLKKRIDTLVVSITAIGTSNTANKTKFDASARDAKAPPGIVLNTVKSMQSDILLLQNANALDVASFAPAPAPAPAPTVHFGLPTTQAGTSNAAFKSSVVT
mmetsp:Transcript_3850/g.5680  ORF Transcript_3850/g.5680 Transcript_3850/m.5680 type:complete len:360 (-) Transcript_3850:240-1319(-)